MKNQIFIKAVLFCLLIALVLPSVQAAPASSASSRRFGLFGDWVVKMDYDGRSYDSILYFTRDREGNRIAQWISFWGVSDLKDFKYEDGKLSFTQERPNREGQTTTSKFTGTIKDRKLTGTFKSDRGEYKLEGAPAKRISRAAGSWAIKFKVGEREITSTLVVKTVKAEKAGEEDTLAADWQSPRYELKSQVTDVQYERGKLTFKRTSNIEDRQRDSTFEGSIDRQTDTLSGVMKSESGEIKVEGKRIGTPVIGTWDLDLKSERGERKQRLVVNRDMSGLYGAIPIKKVNLENDKVTFKIVMEFGERKFELNFAGKLKDNKLTGELKSSMGTSDARTTTITGTKVVRTFRRSGTSGTTR